MKCHICESKGKKIFNQKILGKYSVDYFQCTECEAVFTEQPYWISEAYEESITEVDTGIMARNVYNSMIVNYLIRNFFKTDGNFLDFGGGYGIFTRMMRDLGYKFVWKDKYSPNLLARGYEYQNQEIEAVTSFEAFEHFEDPMKEIEAMLSYSKNIIFSTLTFDKVPDKHWWYYCFETGQHIIFYSKKTLSFIADRFGLNYYCVDNGMHIFTERKLNPKKIVRISNNKFCKLYGWFLWIWNARQGLAVSDMEEQRGIRKKHG